MRKKLIDKSPIDDWSAPISFVKTEEHNNFGETHQNNICWEMFRDYAWSIGFIWFSQFAGPFRIGESFASGMMYFKEEEAKTISEMSSEELKEIFAHKRFRIKERDGYRLKNRFNLLKVKKKKTLMSQLHSLSNDKLNEYFEYGGRIIDFFEA